MVNGFWQLYYTISGEELFVFCNKKTPYLYGLRRFANAYIIRLLGGVDKFLSALIVFMVINYIAEMLLVIVVEEKRSNVFLLKNMFKKAAIFILVIVSNIVGTIIESSYAIRTTVILFYISNEGLAILKNINRLGVPLPQILVKMLNQIGDGE